MSLERSFSGTFLLFSPFWRLPRDCGRDFISRFSKKKSTCSWYALKSLSFSLKGTWPTSFHSFMRARTWSGVASATLSLSWDSFSSISSFFSRFAFSTERSSPTAFSFASKKALHALRKRSQIAFEFLRLTGPISFQSCWSLTRRSVVLLQSVLSLRASAFSQRAIFFARFSFCSSLIAL